MTRRERAVLAHQSARPLKEFLRRHRSLLFILLLVVTGTVGAADLLRHGGRSANPSWLYSWARPRSVVVSQRPPALGTTDALIPLERAGTPVLRTWQRGAIHFRWTPDGIITQGFLDLNGCRSLPAWPTGESVCSRRVFAMLLSSPWVLHDAAGRIVISLAGFLLRSSGDSILNFRSLGMVSPELYGVPGTRAELAALTPRSPPGIRACATGHPSRGRPGRGFVRRGHRADRCPGWPQWRRP